MDEKAKHEIKLMIGALQETIKANFKTPKMDEIIEAILGDRPVCNKEHFKAGAFWALMELALGLDGFPFDK